MIRSLLVALMIFAGVATLTAVLAVISPSVDSIDMSSITLLTLTLALVAGALALPRHTRR